MEHLIYSDYIHTILVIYIYIYCLHVQRNNDNHTSNSLRSDAILDCVTPSDDNTYRYCNVRDSKMN